MPTAETLAVARPPCVVKADGLAAGKGVFVCRTQEELDAGLRAAAAFGGALVIEELLEGEEVSLFALSDGARALPLAPAQDYKRIGDGDTGPNTGGMGAYSPVAGPRRGRGRRAASRRCTAPVLEELARRGAPFVGLLYAGLMLTDGRPAGARVQLPLRRSGDAGRSCRGSTATCSTALAGAATRRACAASRSTVGEAPRSRSCSPAGDYPARSDSGTPIDGRRGGGGGGRARLPRRHGARGRPARHERRADARRDRAGDDVGAARERAYEAASRISFAGMRYRRDIALTAAEGHVRS